MLLDCESMYRCAIAAHRAAGTPMPTEPVEKSTLRLIFDPARVTLQPTMDRNVVRYSGSRSPSR